MCGFGPGDTYYMQIKGFLSVQKMSYDFENTLWRGTCSLKMLYGNRVHLTTMESEVHVDLPTNINNNGTVHASWGEEIRNLHFNIHCGIFQVSILLLHLCHYVLKLRKWNLEMQFAKINPEGDSHAIKVKCKLSIICLYAVHDESLKSGARYKIWPVTVCGQFNPFLKRQLVVCMTAL